MPAIHYYFLEHPAFFMIVVALLGLIVGSFLNVVIHRLPLMMQRQWEEECRNLTSPDDDAPAAAEPYNLVVPRSACTVCGHNITALENIPIVSYMLLRGRCRDCGTPISIQYPLVEALTALLSLAVAWRFGYSLQTAAALPLTWSLIALGVIDFHTRLLPDNITLPMLWGGILVNLGGLFTDLQSSVLGAAFGYLALWSVYQVFKRLTGKEGMGFGDFKLLAMLGAWLGWQNLPLTIILSAVVGSIIGIALMVVRGRDRNVPIPFGPFLSIAGWIALLWGSQINSAYLRYAIGG